MGVFDWIGDHIWKPFKEKVLEPVFGSRTGKLTPFTSAVAAKATMGADNLGDALVNSLTKGGAIDAVSFAAKEAGSELNKAVDKGAEIASRVPIVGPAIAAELEAAAAPLKTTVAELEKPQEALKTAAKLGGVTEASVSEGVTRGLGRLGLLGGGRFRGQIAGAIQREAMKGTRAFLA
jgi:hypothetical protein